MTDSMKFGPEWLRNMSADSTNISLSSSSSNAGGSSSNSASSASNGGGHQSFAMNSNSQPVYNSGPRNTFPEFRYGREEMLSLFDKSYNIPEILPKFKKIFVDKSQLPLALTPSTEEELPSQVAPVTNQRASWVQRSPVGFTTPTRGTGRGGSVDRGRIRGKPNYHQIYQRPAAMFDEDDLRSASLKIDRGWSDRNGAGDSLNTVGGSACGFGVHPDWNDTAISSPRKEFSSHPRNMENWRRNRNDDGSGDSLTTCVGNTEGWRGGNNIGSNFTGHHRWGRSTSWRDEDMPSGSTTDAGYGSTITMQRSNSTITAMNERGCTGINSGSSITKTTQNPYGGNTNQPSSRTFTSLSVLNSQFVRKTQWNANISICNSSGADNEDSLPEWAMEYPSDGGGTFDASGAFHGSVEENDNTLDSMRERKKDYSCKNSLHIKEGVSLIDKKPEDSTQRTEEPVEFDQNKNNTIATSNIEAPIELPEKKVEKSLNTRPSHLDSSVADLVHSVAGELGTNKPVFSQRNVENKLKTNTTDAISQPTVISSNTVFYKIASDNLSQGTPSNVQRDLSDRMQEVADDMIEKLIMDDDTVITNHNNGRKEIQSEHMGQSAKDTPTPAGRHLAANIAFMPVSAILSPQNPVIQGPASIPPIMASTVADDGVHKSIQLYGGGVIIDHTVMHHHIFKQQQIAAAALTNLAPISNLSHGIHSAASAAENLDLWYYRDPQSKVQGPFTAVEMAEWYRAGYFNGNLYVRRLCDSHFRSLGELIKLCNDNMPFTHSHLLPNFDNLSLVDTMATVKRSQKPLSIADYRLEQQTHQKLQQGEQLNCNTSSGADFLENNGKDLMVPVDVSNMYIQMLPHQEISFYNELSANECFQHLTQSEKEVFLRQKLQLRADYLRNVSDVNISLASMNPSVGTNQLYDVMNDGPNKDNIFTQISNTSSINITQLPDTTTYLDAENFQMNSTHRKQPIPSVFNGSPFGTIIPPGEENNSGKLDPVSNDSVGNELLDNLGMRMFFSNGNSNPPLSPNQNPMEFIRASSGGFLNDSEFPVNRSSVEQSNLNVHSWLSPIPNRASIISHQSPSEWSNNILVGIPNSSPGLNVNLQLESPQQPKPIQTDLWILEQTQSDHIKQESPLQINTNMETMSSTMQNMLSKVEQPNAFDGSNSQSHDLNTSATLSTVDANIQSQQKSLSMLITPTTTTATNQPKYEHTDKNPNVGGKRIIKPQTVPTKAAKEFDDCGKKNQEERRRDQVEEKRRQREEKKRQQSGEEKRRQQKGDEDKRRQMIEEKEQQQIQGQRRKAMVGGNTLPSTNSPAREQRMQSSIAPWSSQVNVSAASGPCLAEIQKAERRERQMEQRQVETLVKRVRTGAVSAVEAFDPMLKWNAPLKEVPVKSFAEIQAEEAKRLVDEQTELQRRKEYEQVQVVPSMTATINSGINNISAIWSGTKVWGSTSATGFWEEPVKLSADITCNNNVETDTSATKGTNSCSNNNSTNLCKQAAVGHQKLSSSITANHSVTGQITNNSHNPNPRNLRKSQTLPAMQNSGQQNGKNQHNSNSSKIPNCNKAHRKYGGNDIEGAVRTDKKSTSKNQPNNFSTGGITSVNKKDDYENEFIIWCTKSLSNMNTKLDVPTFVTFLRDLESPYEVKDYIRMYLGENKESSDFGKQFLERRSTYKNLQRAQNAHNDDMCKPAPAITPCHMNDNCDYKGKQRKVKKSKMTKLDARALGFSVTAAEGRTNVGDRVYVDAP